MCVCMYMLFSSLFIGAFQWPITSSVTLTFNLNWISALTTVPLPWVKSKPKVMPNLAVSIQSRTQSNACSRVRVGIGSGETESICVRFLTQCLSFWSHDSQWNYESHSVSPEPMPTLTREQALLWVRDWCQYDLKVLFCIWLILISYPGL